MNEQNQSKQEQEQLKESLGEVIGAVEIEGTEGETMITKLDAISGNWRRSVTRALMHTDEASYKKYREIKYSGGANDNPDLKKRREAYDFAVEAFVDAVMPGTDFANPFEWGQPQMALVGVIQQAVSIVRVVAPEEYSAWQVAISMAKGEDGFIADKDALRSALVTVCKAFLSATYKLANF
jgi:hypothetical protein